MKWFTYALSRIELSFETSSGSTDANVVQRKPERLSPRPDRHSWDFHHSSDCRDRRGGDAEPRSARGDPDFECCRGGVWHGSGPGACAIATFNCCGGQTEITSRRSRCAPSRPLMAPALFVEFGPEAIRQPRCFVLFGRVAPRTGRAGAAAGAAIFALPRVDRDGFHKP